MLSDLFKRPQYLVQKRVEGMLNQMLKHDVTRFLAVLGKT